ncbi:MAG: copper-translocating P-type ATPase [Bacillati bacterium ANGP1]|uniref:Copper-translocating P-type ATPase n=1 Tax=Candidatus Segetimicrobium genomatis TaxID=2569760 RepID=A0A537LCL5_9BACT|nr:MAG: copper-translocating P-type ATPase [Terrabacteria group bacterium ANGP1]
MEHHHEKAGRTETHVHRHESAHDGHPHEHHAGPAGQQMDHGGHEKHAGHSPEMFRNRFFVSLVLTVPILYYEHLFQQWFGYRAMQFPGSEWITPVLAVVIFFYGGWPFVEGARRELAARQPGMMTLVALAISVAFTYSIAVSLGLAGMPFYWELATLVDVMLLGHWMEMLSIQGASRALEHLALLVPPIAHRVTDRGTEDVSISELREGDVVLVRPGEQVPVDGVVEDGTSSVNEAFLTGESRPVMKERGNEVVAGAVNGEGALRVHVTRTGERTTLNQMMRLVRDAQASRSRFQALADRAAYWLTLVALGAGAATAASWAAAGREIAFVVERAVTVLVIACPHALGLAVPLVIVNATSLSASNGILVRNREAFERARDLRIVAFDKTGTLTEGRFVVRGIYADGSGEEEALRLAAGLEASSEHPLARAVVEEGQRRGVRGIAVTDFRAVAGKGVEGRLDGAVYRAGRPEWAEEMGIGVGEAAKRGLSEAAARGESVIALMDKSRMLAVIVLADRVRDSAREAVRQLKEMGVQVVMVTGDAEAVAKTVAQDLRIERYHARVLPQDKSRIVRELRREGPVAFVGDGINDAPALLEADLGVAIGAGTNVAIESADLVLVENDPLDVVRALRLSKATYGKMVQNLFWAAGYNAVAIPMAAGVLSPWRILLSPAAGALLMSLSTVIVAVNAMLLRRVRL